MSYMSRGIGSALADSIQQRGRFFGYKRSYMGYCRIFLLPEIRDAFAEYVEHEGSLRQEIQASIDRGEDAKNWKRAFALSSKLNLCRKIVVEKRLIQGKFSAGWVYPHYQPLSTLFISHNSNLIKNFLSGRKVAKYRQPKGSYPKLDIQELDVPATLQEIREELLSDYQHLHVVDTERLLGALIQLNVYDERREGPSEKCDVFLINPSRNKEMQVDANGNFDLFQGASRRYSKIINNKENVAVQIHYLDLLQGKKVLLKNAPILAFWIPPKLAEATKSWIIEGEQGNG